MPSITVSPIVATRPPSTVGSTTTFTSTCLPVASRQRVGEPLLLRVVERDRGADLGDLVLALGAASSTNRSTIVGEVAGRGRRRR